MNPTSGDFGSIELNPMSQQHQHEINILSASHNQPSRSLSLNLPRQDLLDGRGEDYNEICVPLHKASTIGDLKAAKLILDNCPELARFSITESYETVLHIAVLGKSNQFVKYLVSLLTNEDVELQNGNGETALCLAAMVGNVDIANILVKKNKGLLDIPDSQGRMPLYMAALFGKHDMVKHLYHQSKKMTGDLWTCENRGLVLVKCVESNLFDVALEMVTDHPELAINGSLLGLLARKPDELYVKRPVIIKRFIRSICHPMIGFPDKESHALQLLRIILTEIGKLPKAELDDIIRGPPDQTKEDEKQTHHEKETQEALQLLRTISENVAKMPAKIFCLFKRPVDEKATTSIDAKQKYSSRVLFLAAQMGNTAFVVEFIRRFPHLVPEVNDDNQSIFHVAVSHGHKGIYKLLYEIGSIRDLIIALEDKNGNNMLHLVGEKAKGNRQQNIREVGLGLNPNIFWFKEIETQIPPHLREKKNKAGLTPHEVFIKNHKDLFSKGEKWMKEIATQLMVVAALLAAISCAAAIEYPGESEEDGYDLYLQNFEKNVRLKLFIIFDSWSFISSTTSILMVLSILGSSYDEYDFMISLSKQLVICLTSVFISITTIILTFLIILFEVYQGKFIWIPVIISVFTAIPFLIFSISKYRLLGSFIHGFRMLYETNVSARKSHSN